MNFKIQKGIFMLNNKTQDCFLNNLTGCFYKNYLILNSKTQNNDLVLDVVDLNIDKKTLLKGPKVSKLKIDIRELSENFSASDRLKDLLSDVRILYTNYGAKYGLTSQELISTNLKSKDVISLNSDFIDEQSFQEICLFFMQLAPLIKDLKLRCIDNSNKINLHPFRYALNLDKYICDLKIKNPTSQKMNVSLEILLKNNWREWALANKLTNSHVYDVILINSNHLVAVQVDHCDIRTHITDLSLPEGIFSAAVCDINVLKTLLQHRFNELDCNVDSYSDLSIDFTSSKQTSFLPIKLLKTIPEISSPAIEKYIKKELSYQKHINTYLKLDDLIDEAKTLSQNALFSSSFGIPYINNCENTLKARFKLLLKGLEEEGITFDQLKIANIISNNSVEKEISHYYSCSYKDIDVNEKLLTALVMLVKNTDCTGAKLDESLLLAISRFEKEFSATPLLIIQRNSKFILIYEPNDKDDRLVEFEWFYEATYNTLNTFEQSSSYIHKANIKTSLENAEILHVYQSRILSWNTPIRFYTPTEKKLAFDKCMSDESVKNEIRNLNENCKIHGYLNNLVTSLHDTKSASEEHSVLGFFLAQDITIIDDSYAYKGLFFELDETNQIDTSVVETKTILSKDFPKNYLTFKRLIGL